MNLTPTVRGQQSSEEAGASSGTYDTGHHTRTVVPAGEDTGGRTSAKWAAEEGDQKAWREPGGPNDKSAASGGTEQWGASAGPGLSTKGGKKAGFDQPWNEHGYSLLFLNDPNKMRSISQFSKKKKKSPVKLTSSTH